MHCTTQGWKINLGKKEYLGPNLWCLKEAVDLYYSINQGDIMYAIMKFYKSKTFEKLVGGF